MEPLQNTLINERYKIIKILGQGGFGSVYEALDTKIANREVAIKLLNQTVQNQNRSQLMSLFRKEAGVMSRLSHPNTLRLLDYGETKEGIPYLVSELIKGQTLRSYLQQEGKLEALESLDIILNIAEALSEAHDLGVTHRDIKPENILITNNSERKKNLKLLDFGIAKIKEGALKTIASGIQEDGEMGTAIYMSPEQHDHSDSVDQTSDIYSLGIVLFECLSGKPPFEGKSYYEIVKQHKESPIPFIKELKSQDISDEIIQEINDLISNMLQKEKSNRVQKIEILTDKLEKIINEIKTLKYNRIHLVQIKKDTNKRNAVNLIRMLTESAKEKVVALSAGKLSEMTYELAKGLYEIFKNTDRSNQKLILDDFASMTTEEIEVVSNDLAVEINQYHIHNTKDIEQTKQFIQQSLVGLKEVKNQLAHYSNPSHDLIKQSINHGLLKNHKQLGDEPSLPQQTSQLGAQIIHLMSMRGSSLKPKLSESTIKFSLENLPNIPNFEIKGLLGKGSFATVYLAVDQSKDPHLPCALKIGLLDDPKAFEREVKNMKAIHHPNLLSCWDAGTVTHFGRIYYWISMANMRDITVHELLQDSSFDEENKWLVLDQILAGLVALHHQGIVHRDLKPSNCLISDDFQIKISDFGLSKNLSSSHKDLTLGATKLNQAVGTPAYMSPEQFKGKNISFESDVWSFGVISYQLFSGILPFNEAENEFELGAMVLRDAIDFKILENKLCPQAIEIIRKCLEKDSHLRYANAGLLQNDFHLVSEQEKKRISKEKYKHTWSLILDQNLISKFVLHQYGKVDFQPLSVQAFASFCSDRIKDFDRLMMAEILKEINEIAQKQEWHKLLSLLHTHEIENQKYQLQKNHQDQINTLNLSIKQQISVLDHQELAQVLEKITYQKHLMQSQIDHQLKQGLAELDTRILQSKKISVTYIETILEILKKYLPEFYSQYKQKQQEDIQASFSISVINDESSIEPENKKNHYILYFLLIACVFLISIIFGYLYTLNQNTKMIVKLDDQNINKILDQSIPTARFPVAIDQSIPTSKPTVLDQSIPTVSDQSIPVVLDQSIPAVLDQSIPAVLDQSIPAVLDLVSVKIQFILIKGGSFMMGSESGSSNEIPVHKVEVKDFYMSKTEVTVGQYRKCVEAGVCSEPYDKNYDSSCNWGYIASEDYPINCVDWKQARTFAKWVGGDLPSEAQWEYASRSGGKEIKYPWGNTEATCEYAVMYDGENGCGRYRTWEVCSKTGGNTAQGLCDMGGNVWEWVLDEYHTSYRGAPSDDIGWCSYRVCDSDTSAHRVLRGGSWYDNASGLRSAYRYSDSPGVRDRYVGFRVSYLVH